MAVLLVGIIDLAKHFHPFCMVVTKRETAKDFAFAFKSLKDGLKIHFNFDYKPNTLLADSAPAITNGFTLGFGYPPRWRIICWAHALKKFDNKYSSVIPVPANKKDKVNNIKSKAREDLLFLQTSVSMNIFQIARKLLLEKWKKIKPVSNCFIDFFRTRGTEATQNWFEGYHLLRTVSSQNNGIEGTNKHIKDKATLRKRLPISQFVELVKNKIVKDWSTDRNPLVQFDQLIENINCKKFHTEPNIELPDLTAAYHLSIKEHQFVKYPSTSNTYYYSTIHEELHKQQIKDWKAVDINKIDSFDILKTHLKSMRIVELNSENWKLSKCNCPWFFKNYICSHVIILATIVFPTVKFPN